MISAKLEQHYSTFAEANKDRNEGFPIEIQAKSVNTHHLQQQELVAFLYHRFRFGIFITLFVSALASALAYIELEIQGREHWIIGWFVLLCLVLLCWADGGYCKNF